jgi:hypothetical protein
MSFCVQLFELKDGRMNNLHQYTYIQGIGNPNKLKVFGSKSGSILLLVDY